MVINNDADNLVPRSHLFMLRIWLEDIGNEQAGWRARVQHVSSGEVRYFHDWSTLEAFVEGLVSKTKPLGDRINAIGATDNQLR